MVRGDSTSARDPETDREVTRMATARRCRRIALGVAYAAGAVVLAFTALALLVGCSHHQAGPLAAITPGPPVPARPGAHVWVVGLPDVVVGSADGGATWKLAHRGELTNDYEAALWGVAFGDVADGWAIERSFGSRPEEILATADGGATWSWQHTGLPGTLLAIAATDARHAWAVGYRAHSALVLATTDGGTTWRRQTIPGHVQIYDVAFGDSRHGWALGGNPDRTGGIVFSTADGGAHWRLSYSTKTARLSRLASSGPRRCWVVGSKQKMGFIDSPGFVVSTRDGGTHWQTEQSVSLQPLDDVAFPDPRHGWAVGVNGTIIATSDGGATWVAQHTDQREPLVGVAFSDASHGWILLGHRALLATINGGATWTVVKPTQTEYYLAAVTCLGPGKGK